MSIRILSLNACGLNNDKKRRIIFQYARDRADIILLQESHSIKEKEKIWTAEWGDKILFSHGESNSRGVCLLYRKRLTIKLKYADSDGRLLICSVENGLSHFLLCAVYAPNQDKPSFFSLLSEYIREFLSPQLIVIGDFNLVLNETNDRFGTVTNNNKSKKLLRK